MAGGDFTLYTRLISLSQVRQVLLAVVWACSWSCRAQPVHLGSLPGLGFIRMAALGWSASYVAVRAPASKAEAPQPFQLSLEVLQHHFC